MSAEDARSGRCACGKDAVLTTKVKKKDGTIEYNAFCKGCLGDVESYVQEIKEAA